MSNERARYGLFVSALGALVLAVSVFLPWYGGSFAAPGAVPIGHRAAALTGQQALSGMSVLLLVLAGLALLDALFGIARAVAVTPDGAGGAVVVLASACVIYRMALPPADLSAALDVSLREGWTSLLGSLMVSLGGLWPRALPGIVPGEALTPDFWSTLAGCAPGRRAGKRLA